jgi:UDP-glucose 4-epimerase
MTERMLADVSFAHPLNHCALRYFNVAGADPQGALRPSTAGATHLIKVAVEAAIGKRSHVSVYGTDYDTPDGTGIRDYIHVSDLAAAHVDALEKLIAEPETSYVMNCDYSRGFSVLEVLDAVDRVTNMKIERRNGGARGRRPRRAPSRTTGKICGDAPLARPEAQRSDTIVTNGSGLERTHAERGAAPDPALSEGLTSAAPRPS